MHDASLPPINSAIREAEKVAVAAILNNVMSANDCDFTGLEFTNPEYQFIILGALHLTRDGSLLDIVELSHYLNTHKADYTHVAPNPQVLAQLAQHPLPANIRPTIRLIHSNKARAELYRVGQSLTEWAKDASDDPLDIIERTSASLGQLRGLLGRDDVTYKHLSEIAPMVQKQYEDFVSGVSHNIPTGIEEIDSVTMGGGAQGDLWVIGAPSGQGKSAFALSLARYQASNGYPVLIISREMLDTENYKRIHSSISDVPMYMIRPHLEQFLFDRLNATSHLVQNYPIYIDSTASDLPSIKRSITHAIQHAGVKAVYVDYLQLIKSSKKNQRHEEVAEVSRTFKEIAMEHKIWVCALAQYNRAAIISGDIQNHSFQDSSQIEKDASIILHLELEHVEKGARIPKWREASIYMGKARNAPSLSIKQYFRGETFTFAQEMPNEGY